MSQTNSNEEFKMTKEELDKFEKAMKDEEFRKLLVEYAEEISNPENKKKYEEEIAQMEKMRGMDVKFVNPEDGYVVKTTDVSTGVKAFVNICSNQHIGKPSSQYVKKEENGEKRAGHQWNIPYSLSQPRDDVDRAGKKCAVYDAVFHPDTYKKGQEDKRFKQLMIDTAFDGIQREFKVTLDRKNLKFPKMKFKGVKQSTVIRTKTKEVPEDSAELTIGGMKFPYPYSDQPTVQKEDEKKPMARDEKKKMTSTPNVPKYRIVHRGHIDLQNFTHARDSNPNTRPKELVVYIDLPLLESAAPVELDILEKKLMLVCKKPPYNAYISLPYPVDEENGAAKFDKSKRQLIVTLPVLPAPLIPQMVQAVDTENQIEAEQCKNEEQLNTVPKKEKEPFSNTVPCDGNKQSEADSVDERAKPLEMNTEDNDNAAWWNKTLQQNAENDLFDSPEDEDDTDIRFKLASSSSDFSSPSFFKCPPYNYQQNNEVITFIIDVPDIALDSVSLGFRKNKAYISFPSGKSRPGELPSPDYALYLQFPDDHNLDSNLCNIDVSKQNLVLSLHKEEACKGIWDSFEAGSGEESLETKFFVTEKTVDMMMKEIAEQDPWSTVAPDGEANVKVSSLTEDCLSLEIDTNPRHSADDRDLLGFQSNSKEEELDKPEHMGENISSCEEVNVADLAEELQRTKLNKSPELNGYSCKEHEKVESENVKGRAESVSSDPGMIDTEAAWAEMGDSFVPIDVISNAVRTRRSILRRTSSTSTDDSLGDENEFNGVPDSPSKKNVRFNLNHNVRVFSNKKDKKKRKLEAKLKAEARKHSLESEGSESEQSNGTSPVDNGTGWDGFDVQPQGKGTNGVTSLKDPDNGELKGVDQKGAEFSDDQTTGDDVHKSTGSLKGASESFGMTNNLIFELDD
ncbi:protein kintoun-like [Oculina patagonica]